MKILSIRIKNLASFSGEQFIDFEVDPLASAGLIAITGKTGAGKSTILDAMCLALFNRIPRLKGSEGKIKDVDGSELNANAPQTILRKGTSHGFAELHFIAQDQKCYCARWEIKRARDKSTGKLGDIKRTLSCVSDGVVLATARSQVENYLKTITQLSFEQFTRAVLLAQSEVTAFLKAKDAERGELLEYLTNSSIFGKIGEMAFRKTADIAKKRKDIENVIGHISLLSDEAVSELKHNFAQTQQDYQHTEQQLNILQQQQQWYERLAELEQNIQQRQHTYHQALHACEALIADKQHVQRFESFADLRPTVMQQQNALKQQVTIHPQRQQLESNFQNISQDYQQQQQHYQQCESLLTSAQQFEKNYQTELKEIRRRVHERLFFLKAYKQNDAEYKALEEQEVPLSQKLQQHQQQLQQTLKQQQDNLTQLQKQSLSTVLDKGLEQNIVLLQRFILQYQPLEKDIGHFSNLQHSLAQQTQQQQNLLTKHGSLPELQQKIEQCRQQRENLHQQLQQIDFIQPQVQKWLHDLSERTTLRNAQQHATQYLTELQQHVNDREKNYNDAKQQRVQLQSILQQQRLLHTENVEKLREHLVDGQACMVCGSHQHPYRQAESTLSKTLFQLQQQQEQDAIQQEQHDLEHLQKLKADRHQTEFELQQAQSQEKQLQQRINQSTVELTAQFKSVQLNIDLDQNTDTIQQKLTAQKNHLAQQKSTLDSEFNSTLQHHKDLQDLTQRIQQQQHILQQATQVQAQIQFIVDELSVEQQQLWQQNPLQLIEQCLTQFQSRLIKLQQQAQFQTKIAEQKHQIHLLMQHHEQCLAQMSQLKDKQHEVQQDAQQNNTLAMTLISQISAESPQTPQDWLAQYDVHYQQKQQDYQQQKEKFEHSRQRFDTHKQQLDTLTTQYEQLEKQAQEATQHIQTWLTHHSDFNPDIIHLMMQISHEEMQQLRQNIQQIERHAHDAMTALNTIQEALAQHQHSQPPYTFNEVQQQFEKQHASLTQFKQHADELKLQLEMHQQNLTNQQKFSAQIEEIQQEEHRWHKISIIIGDAKGKTFRDYAQQYHLDILLEYANQQLQQLSQRYTLQRLENSLSLAIIDHDMDGEIRSVASLSGGESFLTALALSLAIANMASGELKIESLFIDEGFGTLDASSLHMVMDALDRLQSQGRKVVLISHIAEMHERIPVQIQVQPLGSGSSRIHIVS